MKLNLFFLPITLLILVLFPVIYFWIYFLPQKWQVTISRIPVKIWCKTVFISFGIKLHYHGETTLKKKPLVILSNHQSSIDSILVLFFFHCGFITKYSLAIPLLGWSQKILGSIRINRSSIASFRKVRLKCSQRLKQKITICLFPEGTRGSDNKLLPFKRGMLDFYYREQVATLVLVNYAVYPDDDQKKAFPFWGKKIILCECGFVDPKNYSNLKLFIEACQQRMIPRLKAERYHSEKAETLYHSNRRFMILQNN